MKLKAIITNLLLAVLVGFGFSAAGAQAGIAINPLTAGGAIFTINAVASTLHYGLTGLSFSQGLSMMAVQQEFWQDRFEENLFKYGNEFLKYAVSGDKYVLNGSVVHIPQAGATPTVTKNRTSHPNVTAVRADTDVTYALDTFDTDATLIPAIETMENDLNKADSVVKDHFGTLMDAAADEILFKWSTSTAGNIIRCTGALSGDSLAPSATGTRKILLKEDITQMRKLLRKSKVKGSMVATVPTDMYTELLLDEDFVKSSNVHVEANVDLGTGEIRRWNNITIIERIDTTIYDAALAPKAPGAAAAATDHQAVICWIDQAVERALGLTKLFETLGQAQYQGDLYSALIKAGGRIRRNAEGGTGAIVQEA